MPRKQKRFTKDFEDEAVRLVRASGRTKREIAADLCVGLSTLTRWIAHGRDRPLDKADGVAEQDVSTVMVRGLTVCGCARAHLFGVSIQRHKASLTGN